MKACGHLTLTNYTLSQAFATETQRISTRMTYRCFNGFSIYIFFFFNAFYGFQWFSVVSVVSVSVVSVYVSVVSVYASVVSVSVSVVSVSASVVFVSVFVVSWLVGWLVGWVGGWLVGCPASFLDFSDFLWASHTHPLAFFGCAPMYIQWGLSVRAGKPPANPGTLLYRSSIGPKDRAYRIPTENMEEIW